jgi:hypothetical protein
LLNNDWACVTPFPFRRPPTGGAGVVEGGSGTMLSARGNGVVISSIRREFPFGWRSGVVGLGDALPAAAANFSLTLRVM